MQADHLDELRRLWSRHVEMVEQEAPFAIVEDGGETIYTGELSPGCQACKAGGWDCLFLTMECNLACPFCCSPDAHGANIPLSALGNDVDEVIQNLRLVQPDGISFSGGEIFLDFERLRNLAARIRREFPRAYLWLYTNGVLATREMTAELGQIGIDEFRFNLAASGYNQPAVMKSVAQASRVIKNVSVEIPAIPADAKKILLALPDWSSAGVRFLNLHELMYEPGSLSAALPGPRMAVYTPDGHFTEIHPESRALTLKIIQAIHNTGLPISVNDCSIQNKLRQVRGRRSLVGRLIHNLPDSTESLDEEGVLHTMCGVNAEGSRVYIRPENFPEVHNKYPGYRFTRLWREPTLSIYAPAQWFEEVA